MAEFNAEAVLLIMSRLHQAQIRAYIVGGWGLDALLGYQTRLHTDLDISFDASAENQILQMFETEGYGLSIDLRPVRFVVSNKSEQAVDFHPVVFDMTGAGVQQGFEGEFYYPARDFIQGTIAGAAVPCISAELQTHFHDGYQPTPKDCIDMRLLHTAFGITLPPNYTNC